MSLSRRCILQFIYIVITRDSLFIIARPVRPRNVGINNSARRVLDLSTITFNLSGILCQRMDFTTLEKYVWPMSKRSGLLPSGV